MKLKSKSKSVTQENEIERSDTRKWNRNWM